jgi:hypothetical protein
MADDGTLLDDTEPFGELIYRCEVLERRATLRSEGVGHHPGRGSVLFALNHPHHQI